MRIILILILISFSMSQSLDPIDIKKNELRNTLDNASRNGQRVLIEDFTGAHYCPYCGYGSFAVSDLLDEYPSTLTSLQYHLGSYTDPYSDLDDCYYQGQTCFDARGIPYGWNSTITGVPFEVFNGDEVIVGASSEESGYYQYSGVYNELVTNETPYEINIGGVRDDLDVNYNITVSLDETPAIPDNKQLHIFVVEDNIMTSWFVWEWMDHNSRNVVRQWLGPQDISIASGGETQAFSGSFTIEEGAWDPDSVKIVALIQDSSDHIIHQVQESNVNDLCDDIVFVPGNIDGSLNTDETISVDIFDVLSLADIVEFDITGTCGQQISDLTGDGNINLLDIITLATLISQGDI